MNSPTLMLQGTTRGAGKSTLIAGLAHARQRRGQRVTTFHPSPGRPECSATYKHAASRHDLVLIEGGQSAADVHRPAIARTNMALAETLDCPVVLVADIDRGGVFAQIVGTLSLFSQPQAQRVDGFVINRFRGDVALLQPGLDWLEQRTGKPVLGVLPYLQGFSLDDRIEARRASTHLDTLVIQMPDLTPDDGSISRSALSRNTDVSLHMTKPQSRPAPADLVILPDSREPEADGRRLRETGWHACLERHLRYGGKLVALGAGGERLLDHLSVTGASGTGASGTGERARIESDHSLAECRQLAVLDSAEWLNNPRVCQAVLEWCGVNDIGRPDPANVRAGQLERLADTIERHIDLDRLP